MIPVSERQWTRRGRSRIPTFENSVRLWRWGWNICVIKTKRKKENIKKRKEKPTSSNWSTTSDITSGTWRQFGWSVIIRVSQKTQKSEFWNVTYPSGFHRLDESSGVSLKRSCKMQFRRVGLRSIGPSSQKLWPNQFFGRFPRFFLVAHLTYENHWGK